MPTDQHRTELEEAEHRIIGQTREQAIAEVGADRYNELITVFVAAHKDDPGTIGNPLALDDLPGMWEAADITGGETEAQP